MGVTCVIGIARITRWNHLPVDDVSTDDSCTSMGNGKHATFIIILSWVVSAPPMIETDIVCKFVGCRDGVISIAPGGLPASDNDTVTETEGTSLARNTAIIGSEAALVIRKDT